VKLFKVLIVFLIRPPPVVGNAAGGANVSNLGLDNCKPTCFITNSPPFPDAKNLHLKKD